jgi:hypothetical protein
VNGLHAVVVAPALVRIEMLRKGRTYELLITQHQPGKASEGKRHPLETKVLFCGIHGRLELDLSGKDTNQAGAVVPTFYSLAGEEVTIPKRFHEVIRAITRAVNCVPCSHSHYVRAPHKEDSIPRSSYTNKTHTASKSGSPAESVEAPERFNGRLPTSHELRANGGTIPEVS